MHNADHFVQCISKNVSIVYDKFITHNIYYIMWYLMSGLFGVEEKFLRLFKRKKEKYLLVFAFYFFYMIFFQLLNFMSPK